MLKVRACDLKLGDVLQLEVGAPYMTGTVNQVLENTVTVQRPFVHTGDFSYTGGVLWYIGIEMVNLPRTNREYIVFQRKDLK